MKKITGFETDIYLVSAHEVEVLQDAADQWDEGKNEIFLVFDESTLLIEKCDGQFFMRVFEPGKGIERAFALIQHYTINNSDFYMDSDPENATVEECFCTVNDFESWLTDGKQGNASDLLMKYVCMVGGE